MLYGITVTGLVLSGPINFTRKGKRKQNTTEHFCSLELLLILTAKRPWIFLQSQREPGMPGWIPSFLQSTFVKLLLRAKWQDTNMWRQYNCP